MKTVLKKYLNWYKWKMQNKWENSTSLFINGDLNKVEVGRYQANNSPARKSIAT